jgi:hypothetical protein
MFEGMALSVLPFPRGGHYQPGQEWISRKKVLRAAEKLCNDWEPAVTAWLLELHALHVST